MNSLKIILLPIILLFAHAPTLTQAAGKHALLIGIQDYDYKSSGIEPLKGSLNDVELMKGVLRERFEFQEKDFIILLDAQATHTGIKKAFTTLIQRVKPDDFVYIHYSGHGSQTPDLNGDERRTGKDQTWVSYGARTHTKNDDIDNYDVLDDEINTWLAAIKTPYLIFVSDSCHSATVARGEAPTNRAVKKDNRPHPLGKRAYLPLKKSRGIRIGAARDHESAIETTPREDGKIYGLFTWYWAKALQQARRGETWYDVFKRASIPITAWRGQAQEPQIEGEHNRLLGGDVTPFTPTVAVLDAYGKYVDIQAGYTAGVTIGSVYCLYNPQHPNPQKLPQLTITGVKAFMSYGETEGKNLFKPGDLVIEASHAYHFAPVKVYLSADYPKGKDQLLLQAIETAFNSPPNGKQLFPGYAFTNDPYNADLRLHLLHPKRQNGQLIQTSIDDALPKSFPRQPPELWILTPEQRLLNKNRQIQFDNPKLGIQLLQENLNKLARVRELKMLHSDKALPIAVQTTVFNPVRFCPQLAECVDLPDDLGMYRKIDSYLLPAIETHYLHKDELLTFTLHNQSEQDYYCYLLNIGASGKISAIFPAPYKQMEYARINAGEKRKLTIEDGILMLDKIGEETIKVIATAQPIEVSLLEQSELRQRGARGLNPLEQLLVNTAHGIRGYVSKRNDDWATGQVTFEVE